MRESRERQDDEVASRIMTSILEISGENGYRNVSVQEVIDRYGGNRVQFYRHFASKEDCFAAAYKSEIERLSGRIAAAAEAESSWRLGLRAGLAELAGFVESRPLTARALVIEVHVAGGPALVTRAEVFERAGSAIDGGRRERGSHRPPAVTAPFMLGAIEATATSALANDEPRRFTAAIPELAHLIVSTYMGEDAAAEELRAASAA